MQNPPGAVTTQVLAPPSALTTTIHYLYGTGSVKTWKTRHKISVNIRIFLQRGSEKTQRMNTPYIQKRRESCRLAAAAAGGGGGG